MPNFCMHKSKKCLWYNIFCFDNLAPIVRNSAIHLTLINMSKRISLDGEKAMPVSFGQLMWNKEKQIYQPPKYSGQKMKLVSINNSLAILGMDDVNVTYSDPYYNTLGENNWIIVCLILLLSLCILFRMLFGTIHQRLSIL